LTPYLISTLYRTLYKCTSIELSHIFNAGDVGDAGDVIAIGVAVVAGDGLAAAGNGSPTIVRTAENLMQFSVSATKLLRQLKEWSGCAISSSRT
jgi:hypothetical protein